MRLIIDTTYSHSQKRGGEEEQLWILLDKELNLDMVVISLSLWIFALDRNIVGTRDR